MFEWKAKSVLWAINNILWAISHSLPFQSTQQIMQSVSPGIEMHLPLGLGAISVCALHFANSSQQGFFYLKIILGYAQCLHSSGREAAPNSFQMQGCANHGRI